MERLRGQWVKRKTERDRKRERERERERAIIYEIVYREILKALTEKDTKREREFPRNVCRPAVLEKIYLFILARRGVRANNFHDPAAFQRRARRGLLSVSARRPTIGQEAFNSMDRDGSTSTRRVTIRLEKTNRQRSPCVRRGWFSAKGFRCAAVLPCLRNKHRRFRDPTRD